MARCILKWEMHPSDSDCDAKSAWQQEDSEYGDDFANCTKVVKH